MGKFYPLIVGYRMSKEERNVISIQNLKKAFGKREILKGVDLTIHPGEFYGIFGKNGAGKSTLFKSILGLYRPTSGEITICGKGLKKNKTVIGYMPENISIYGNMTVVDNLKVSAYSSGNKISHKEIKKILEIIDLEGNGDKKGQDLSLGMKRRLQLAMATMTKEADIFILDEPTNGMDINGVIWLKKYLLDLKEKGKTILVCSHSLNIMEDLVDKYCILIDGVIKEKGIWNNKDEKTYHYKLSIKEDDVNNHILNVLNNIGREVKQKGNIFTLKTKDNAFSFSEKLISEGIHVDEFEMEKESLEKIFIESVGGNEK